MALFSGNIRSAVLGMDTGLSVIMPYDRPSEKLQDSPKVLYLLHGLGNNAKSWVTNTAIERYAREYSYVVIMPDAQKSFYIDMAMGEAYFSYVTKELPALCKKMFQFSHRREDTFVAGLSMGGYGAIKCALTYPENYAACAAFSGCLDMEYLLGEIRSDFDLNKMKPVLGNALEVAPENNLFTLAESLEQAEHIPRIYLSCGLQDSLLGHSQRFSSALKVPYTYEEWDGDHNWIFWETSIQKAFEFFLTNPLQ